MRLSDNRRSEPDNGSGDVLWPASFSHRPAARTAAHALAGLVVEFALLLAYAGYFLDGFAPLGRPTGHTYDVDFLAGFVAVSLTVPMLFMFCALVAGLNGGGEATRRLLTGLGWAGTVVVNLFVLLLFQLAGEELSDSRCVVTWPAIPGGLDMVTAAALCVMAALGIGAFTSWAVWNVRCRRGRPIGRTALYVGWLTVVTIAAFLLLAYLFGHFGPYQYAAPSPRLCPG